MKPRELIAEATTPDGAPLTLTREADGYVVRVRGATLMASRAHGSEEAMAAVACGGLRDRAGARVLVGGLGMGFTLRATLDALMPPGAAPTSRTAPAIGRRKSATLEVRRPWRSGRGTRRWRCARSRACHKRWHTRAIPQQVTRSRKLRYRARERSVRRREFPDC